MREFKTFKEAFEYYRDNPDGILSLQESHRASEFSIFLQKGLKNLLLKGHSEYAGVYLQCMSIQPSDMAFETYPNLGSVSTPEQRLPDGEFVRGSFASEDTRVQNYEYGEIIEIDRWLIDNDQTKRIVAMPNKLGQAHARKKDIDTASFYNTGTTTAIYDAVNMFAAAAAEHPNITGGAANTANVNSLALGALTVANLESALASMDGWLGLSGEYLDIGYITLMVATNQRFIAQRILESQGHVVATWADVPNIHRGTLKLVVNKRLTAGTWYILTSVPGNIHQQRRALALTKEADNAGQSFEQRMYRYRSDEAYGQGCADWRFGCKGN